MFRRRQLESIKPTLRAEDNGRYSSIRRNIFEEEFQIILYSWTARPTRSNLFIAGFSERKLNVIQVGTLDHTVHAGSKCSFDRLNGSIVTV